MYIVENVSLREQ